MSKMDSYLKYYSPMIKSIDKTPRASIILNCKTLNASPKIKNKSRCPVSSLLFNFQPEVPATAMRREKEIRGIQITKEERKLSLFVGDKENPKESTNTLLELISEFSKGVGYNVNIQKQLYFYILATNNWKTKFENEINLEQH